MPRRKRDGSVRSLPTIWRVSDELWNKIEPILAQYDLPKHMGRKRIDQRRALNGIIMTRNHRTTLPLSSSRVPCSGIVGITDWLF